jgi:precorrin-6Y C5,15-methyltransferase (decarboxylating)
VRKAVSIVGIGDDGCVGLCSRAMNAVARAAVLVGGERHLAFFPEFAGERIVLKKGIPEVMARLGELCAEQNVCVLASGDPLFFGIGARVIAAVGAEHVEVIPQPTSMQWAFAKVGMNWDDAALLSVHGRSHRGFLTRLRRCFKAACLTDPENTPPVLAQVLKEHGQQDQWRAWVCENLGSTGERVREFSIEELAACTDIQPLNVLILRRTDPKWRPPPPISYLHEDAFAKRMPKKGLITKREVRMLSLAALELRTDSIIWDIGAGSGSISIEAAMVACDGCAYAVEVDPEGVEICRENIRALAVDNVEVIHGSAPEALADLPRPDAVFVGGSKGSMREIIDVCLDRLTSGGRLVVNAITLENIAEAYTGLRAHGLVPEVTLLNVSRGEPLARYLRYEALNPITMFAVTKSSETS